METPRSQLFFIFFLSSLERTRLQERGETKRWGFPAGGEIRAWSLPPALEKRGCVKKSEMKML